TNLGPSDAQNVTVSDTLPGATTFVSVTPPAGVTCSSPGVGLSGTVTCTQPTLASGAGESIILVVAVPGTTSCTAVCGVFASLVNGATVGSSTTDPVTTNNTATATTVVTPSADVSVTKTGPVSVTAGSTVTYTVVVSNAGPSSAGNVTLSDVAPAGTVLIG